MGPSEERKQGTPSTAESLSAAAGGDPAAAGRLIARFEPVLRREVRRFLGPARFREEGEDLLQTVRLQIVRKLPSIRARDRGAWAVWLRTVARNACLDWKKSQGRARRRPESPQRIVRLPTAAPDLPAASPTPSRILLKHEESERLYRAIEKVPERYRRLLRLLAERDPEPEEVARFLGKEAEAARKFTARALLHLRQALHGEASTTDLPGDH
jgi:RNA polymerase sigma factor (sigma-70 family)